LNLIFVNFVFRVVVTATDIPVKDLATVTGTATVIETAIAMIESGRNDHDAIATAIGVVREAAIGNVLETATGSDAMTETRNHAANVETVTENGIGIDDFLFLSTLSISLEEISCSF
jgi:uncharacterized protein YcfJ